MGLWNQITAIEGQHVDSGAGWHVDTFTPDIKALMYLADVRKDNGPFTMLMNYSGALRHKDDPRHRTTRYSDEDVHAHININAHTYKVEFVAPRGTVILFKVNNIHRGA